MKKLLPLLIAAALAPTANAERTPFEAITWADTLAAGYIREGCHMWWKGTGECKFLDPAGQYRINCYLWDHLKVFQGKAELSCQKYPIVAGAFVNTTIPSQVREPSPATIITWRDALNLPGAEPALCYHEMRAQACQVTHPTHDWAVFCQLFQHGAEKLRCRYLELK